LSYDTATSLRRSTASDAQLPSRQVILLPPFITAFVFPACRTNNVLHAGGWGENNSPRQRLLLGQAGPGPAQSSGPGLCVCVCVKNYENSAKKLFKKYGFSVILLLYFD